MLDAIISIATVHIVVPATGSSITGTKWAIVDIELQRLLRQWKSDQNPDTAMRIAAMVARTSESTSDDEPSYSLHLTGKQAQVVIEATDMYSRVQMGQMRAALEPFRMQDNIHEAEIAMQNAVKPLIFPAYANSHGSHGIASPYVPEKAKMAYGIHQVVRHRTAWDRTEAKKQEGEKDETVFSFTGVWHDDPMNVAEHPLPTIAGKTPCPCKYPNCSGK